MNKIIGVLDNGKTFLLTTGWLEGWEFDQVKSPAARRLIRIVDTVKRKR